MDQADGCPVEPQIELSTMVTGEYKKKKPVLKIPTTYTFGRHNLPDVVGRFRQYGSERWVPEHLQFASYERRLLSFRDWPKQMNPKPEELALSGFFYDASGDTVFCFFCGKGIRDWELNDNAYIEHKRWSPNCLYLDMICSV